MCIMVFIHLLLRYNIGGIFLNLHRKMAFYWNREHPNVFIKQSSLNIMNVMRHKRFGYFTVYDKDFLRQDESGRLLDKNMDKFLDESSGFGAKMDKIRIFLPS